ncbi:MAG: hypothetical protein IJB51_11260 [Clostridia bacterium]|nr:hypothetical protein [Clostridia bacterium]
MESVKHRIHIGEPELVRADADFDYTLDAQFVPIKNPDGSWKFLNTSLCEKPYFHKFIGDAENIYQKSELYEMDNNGFLDLWPAGVWVMSAYKFEDGLMAGFCHREMVSRTDPNFGNCFFMGLAVSQDNGESWKYLGDVCSNVLNGGSFMANMGGCPLLVRDGYFYIYFNDADAQGLYRVSGARMKIDETHDALLAGKLPTVKKYTGNGMWETDAMRGTGANILPQTGFQPDTHAKGTYCKALDRYMLTTQTNGQGKLLLFLSPDCEHFDEWLVVDDVGEENVFMQPYSFFMSIDGDCSDDMNVIGREFYIYYPHKGLEHGRGYGYDHDDLYRRRVTID